MGVLHPVIGQDRKAVAYFEKAEEAFKDRSYEKAKVFYDKTIEIHPAYALAYYRLGQIAYTARDVSATKTYYEKVIELDPENSSYVLAYTFLGSEYLKIGEYEKARTYLQRALDKTSKNSRAYQQLEAQITSADFAERMQKAPMVIKPKPMPDILNFKDKQYFPVFTADGESIYYTARNNGADEDIFLAKKGVLGWEKPVSLPKSITTDYNEGTCTISADGKTMVFTGCEGRNGFGSCDLYITHQTSNGGWSAPENMGENVNGPFWDSQPTLSSDGTIMVFASDRYGGEGGKDLYVSIKGEMNDWQPAMNLGKVINTAADEVSPFLHANGSTLFFASKGHPGMGGFDLFMTQKVKGGFETPQNLGYPINDLADQFAMAIAADGSEAYYSIERGEHVKMYQFELPEILKEKINPTYYLKGKVTDKKDEKPLNAQLQLIDLASRNVISTFRSDPQTGEYMVVLPYEGNYGLYVEVPEYFFKSLSFSFDSTTKKSVKDLIIALEKIDKNKIEILNNIYFDTNSSELKPESTVELSKLAELIWRNPTLKVEISGHTDNVGSAEANLDLSKRRAQAVVDYLLSEGLNNTNIKAVGYGETKPMAPNDSEIGRALNRRIELKFY